MWQSFIRWTVYCKWCATSAPPAGSQWWADMPYHTEYWSLWNCEMLLRSSWPAAQTTESQNGWGWRVHGGHLVQPLCSSRITQRQLPMTMPGWLLIITKDGDSMTSLCNLCPCWVALTAALGSSFWRRKYLPCGQRMTSASKRIFRPLGTTTIVMDFLGQMEHIPSIHWELWICRGQTDHQIPLYTEMSETFIL